MNDWVSFYDEYGKDFKDISDVLNDARKLRSLYSARRFDEMNQHIRLLTVKYPQETTTWNCVNSNIPRNNEEAFRAADEFLRSIVAVKIGNYIK